MGQLVFQATLGGQVNLVGPNTASTFNINVPATAGNMVTTGDTGTVTSTMLASAVYTAPGTIGSGTANTGAFTTLSASSTVSGTGFSTYLASPPAIGGTAAAAVSSTALSYTTTLTGGTGIVNIGSGQIYKDASGNLLVGATSQFSACFLGVSFDGTTKNGIVLRTSTNASGAGFAQFVDNNNAACGNISRVGTTSAVIYTASSDRRLKENIVDAPSAIAHINSIKIRSFNWIAGKHQIKYGVIAQEFVEVEPDAVVQGDDTETIKKTWSVDTSALVPAMIKAIQELATTSQEQQAIISSQAAAITALTTRITALEAK